MDRLYQKSKKKRGGEIILFHEKTEKALDKAENANNGNLQLRKKKRKDGKYQEKDKTQHWKKSRRISQDLSTNGSQKVINFKEKELRLPTLGLLKEKQFQSKKNEIDRDDEHDKNEAAGPIKTDKEPSIKTIKNTVAWWLRIQPCQ